MQFNQTSLALWLRWVIASTAGLVLGLLIAGGLMSGEHENYKLLNSSSKAKLFLPLEHSSCCLPKSSRYSRNLFCSRSWTVCLRVFRLTGLLKYSLAPATKQRSRSPGIAKAVSAMIGVELNAGFCRR